MPALNSISDIRNALADSIRTGNVSQGRAAMRRLMESLLESDAFDEMEEAVALGTSGARALNDPSIRARASYLDGVCRLFKGDSATAFRRFDECRRAAREARETRVELQALTAWAGGLIDAGDFVGAWRLLTTAMRLARRHHVRDLEAEILVRKGRVEQLRGRNRRALRLAEEASAVAGETTMHPTFAARLAGFIGMIHLVTGDLPNALRQFYRMTVLADEAGSRRQRARALSSISIVFRHSHDFHAALEMARLALDEARVIDDRGMIASFLGNLGNALNAVGRYEEALESYRESLTRARSIGDRGLEITTLDNIGMVLATLGRSAAAMKSYRESLTMAEETGDLLGIARCRIGIGIVMMGRGDPDGAVAELSAGLLVAEEIGALAATAEAHEQLTNCYETLGKASVALEHYRKGVEIRQSILGAERAREIMELRMRNAIEKEERERRELTERNRVLEMEVEHQLQELNAMAVRLNQTTTMLKSLQHQMGANAMHSDDERNEIVTRMKEAARIDDEWERFELRFNQIHGGFLADLSRRYPELTPSELKVSALLRTQIGTKDIATLLNVGTRVVEKHRWNIRRKLGLGSGDNLSAFLAK